MGFFSDLAELGREIGSEISNLGKELKQIGSDTIDEIKEDPDKYIRESASDIANASGKVLKVAGKVAEVAVTQVLPAVAEGVLKTALNQSEKMLESGALSDDQKAVVENMRQNAKERLAPSKDD